MQNTPCFFYKAALQKIILVFVLCFFATNSYSQPAPDLSKINTPQDKIEAWRLYCNRLLRQDFNFKKVVEEAHKGFALVPNDKDSLWYKAVFNLFIGAAYENMRVYDSATAYIEKSVLQASKTTDGIKVHLQALTRLSYVYTHTRNNTLRNATIDRISKITDTTKRMDIKTLGIGVLEDYYYDIGDYDKALEYGIRWIGYYKQLVKEDSANYDGINIGFEMSTIGGRFTELKQYDKALDYLNQAHAIIGNRALTGNEETLYRNFVAAFLGKNLADSARQYYQLIYKGMAGRDTIYHVLCAANYLFGEYYMDKNIDSALQYTLLARKFGKQAPEQTAYISAGQILGDIYYKKGNFAAALALLRESLNNQFQFDRNTYANINKTMSDCFAELKQWDSAYTYASIYSRVNDSLLNAAANTNFANAEARYQNKEKQAQIASKNAELKAQAIQTQWLIGGLVLAALIATLLVIIYRNKKRTADILDEKNNILSKLNNDLEEANKTKAKLFGIISHDLRSPINQVYQFLKLQQLNPDALSVDQKSTLSDKIQTATGSLLETMEDLLIWSKTQMDSFKVDVQPTTIAPIVDTCQKLLQLNSEAKNIVYEGNLPENMVINTDSYYLQTIIRNLLQNAIKASPQNGTIKINAVQQLQQVVVSIQNMGGAYSHQEYEAFIANGENAKSLTGLGLRLVHELSQKIGAVILFKNPADNTTEVNIILPI